MKLAHASPQMPGFRLTGIPAYPLIRSDDKAYQHALQTRRARAAEYFSFFIGAPDGLESLSIWMPA